MGVKNLSSFLKERAPEAFVPIKFESLRDKAIAIDCNNLVHSLTYIAIKNVVQITDIYKEDLSHQRVEVEVFNLVVGYMFKFLKKNIVPVCVFDGPAVIEKLSTQQKRIAIQTKNKEKLADVIARIRAAENRFLISESDLTEARSLMCRVTILNSSIFSNIKTLLGLFGLCVIQSSTEGEKLCAMLCRENTVAAVLSTDSDTWMYESPSTLRTDKDDFLNFISIRYDRILAALEFTSEQFLEFCIMCGTDYNNNIPGIGPVKAYALIKQNKTIANIKTIDITSLNYDVVKRLVSPVPANTLYDSSIPLVFNKDVFDSNRALIRENYPSCSTLVDYIDRLQISN